MAEHPARNWGIILQQAWTLHMKEKLGLNNANYRGSAGLANSSVSQRKSNGKNCWKYNRGKCTYGFGCKFEHRCGICNKFGHGAHICHKGQQNARDRDDDRKFDKNDRKEGYQKK